MREIEGGVILECENGIELHFSESEEKAQTVIAEVWEANPPTMATQFEVPFSEMVAFVRWIVPPKLHTILREHGVTLTLCP